jgi:hypothetical protein
VRSTAEFAWGEGALHDLAGDSITAPSLGQFLLKAGRKRVFRDVAHFLLAKFFVTSRSQADHFASCSTAIFPDAVRGNALTNRIAVGHL